VKYYRGYNYVVAEAFDIQTGIEGYNIVDTLTRLTPDGKLSISKWYPWDGNSGPCPDNKNSMMASCVHDVLCDYVNLGWLPVTVQPLIDRLYYNIAVSKGMFEWVVRARLLAITWYMAGKGAKRYMREILED